MTFSIAGRCAKTGMFGVAISSSSPAVGARCAHARAGVGAFGTQNVTDPRLGPQGLDLMATGASAEQAIATLMQMRAAHRVPPADRGRCATAGRRRIPATTRSARMRPRRR